MEAAVFYVPPWLHAVVGPVMTMMSPVSVTSPWSLQATLWSHGSKCTSRSAPCPTVVFSSMCQHVFCATRRPRQGPLGNAYTFE